MPLVYVHGIGNRSGPSHREHQRERDLLFRRFLFPVIGGEPHEQVESPVWGDKGARLRWEGASLPRDIRQTLGAGDAGPEALAAEIVAAEIAAAESFDAPERLLCALARRDLADVVDLLFSLSPAAGAEGPDGALLADAAERMVAYCRFRERLCPEPDPVARYPWLAGLTEDQDDLDLLDSLWRESQGWALTPEGEPRALPEDGNPPPQTLGSNPARALLAGGVRALRRASVGLPAQAVAATGRRVLATRSSELIGDILTYLANRGDRDQPGVIPRLITEAIETAAGSAGPTRPLVVVAHSMGGTIVYDALSHFRPDLTVDVLVTVGSQVGLFAELSLLRELDAELPTPEQARIPVPKNIRSWINVVDPADILAYQAEPIFDRVQDYRYPSSALWAHSAYFRQPHFHARLADRVRQALP